MRGRRSRAGSPQQRKSLAAGNNVWDVVSPITWEKEPSVARAKMHRRMIRPCWIPCKLEEAGQFTEEFRTGRQTFDMVGWSDENMAEADDPKAARVQLVLDKIPKRWKQPEGKVASDITPWYLGNKGRTRYLNKRAGRAGVIRALVS